MCIRLSELWFEYWLNNFRFGIMAKYVINSSQLVTGKWQNLLDLDGTELRSPKIIHSL